MNASPLSLTATPVAAVTLASSCKPVTRTTSSVAKDSPSVSVAMVSVTMGNPALSTVHPVTSSSIYATVTSRNPVVTSVVYASVKPRTSYVTSGVTPVTSSLTSFPMATTCVVTEAVIHRTSQQRPASTYDHDLTLSSSSSRSRPQSSASSLFDPTYATIADLDLDPSLRVDRTSSEGQTKISSAH